MVIGARKTEMYEIVGGEVISMGIDVDSSFRGPGGP
jgi:hypothetical protein